MRAFSFLVVLLLLGAAATASPASSRDAREQRAMATELLLDSQGDDALRTFAADQLAPAYRASFADEDALLAHLRAIRDTAGPVGGVGLLVDETGRLELHVENRDGSSVVGLRVEDQAPHRIVELQLDEHVAGAARPTVEWNTLGSFLDEAAENGFSGSVLAIRDGQVVLDRGYGHADPAGRHPVKPETLFAIGSTPIDFTHGAILLLEQRGKVSMDDPITRYFDGVPADKRSITLEHLRTGRSGLIDFPGIEGVDENLDLSWIDRAEFLRRIFAAPLLFEPGTAERHSHAAWGVLAAVIEVASGRDYEDFLRTELFEPAGMTRTGHYPLAQRFPASEVAVGLGGNTWGEINSPAYWGPTSWLVLGSGGMVSTTGDLHRWHTFVRRGGVLGDVARRKYGVDGVFLAEGGNDRGFVNTIGSAGDDLVIVCSNSHVGPDDATARVAMAVARVGTGE